MDAPEAFGQRTRTPLSDTGERVAQVARASSSGDRARLVHRSLDDVATPGSSRRAAVHRTIAWSSRCGSRPRRGAAGVGRSLIDAVAEWASRLGRDAPRAVGLLAPTKARTASTRAWVSRSFRTVRTPSPGAFGAFAWSGRSRRHRTPPRVDRGCHDGGILGKRTAVASSDRLSRQASLAAAAARPSTNWLWYSS